MSSEVTPEGLRNAQFKTTLRGLDRSEVEGLLRQIADRIEFLEGETERLGAQLADSGARDLEAELEKVGGEVNNILQAAREAAESMRERASLDAARWRSEAMADAEENRRSAAGDAEALRRDAWTVGTDLLGQARAEADKMRQEAERDVLTIMGEAEREAHRLTSGSRRDAEDLLRNATMQAEKTISEANQRRDEIIDQANRQAAAAQERTRALEQRRDELLAELENVRATLSRLEGSLEEKRESLDLASESSSVKVVPAPSDEPHHWELGETVRVVQGPMKPTPRPLPDDDLETLAAETATEAPEEKAGPEVTATEPDDQAPVEEAPKAVEEPVAAPSSEQTNDVDALFASLREVDMAGGEAGVSDEPSDDGEPSLEGTDWIEERDARLLPVTNRALRGVKKAITELQNIALDGLRTDEAWKPNPETIRQAVHAELTTVWSESFAAGHSVAEEMTGDTLKRPRTPKTALDQDFGKVLAAEISLAIDEAGSGQRPRQAAASRVYRIWRTDEAERRIREAAIDAFEQGIEKSISTEAPVG
ncbi:MAG: DivIVA domain-containing protein [Acidimicrobiia bacterium]|nr:DivIVA domain-containing protein [Acidimicrobiia bacterium]